MRAQGQTDIPLDDTGVHQAHLLAHTLRKSAVTRVISSDLSRAANTAQILAEALDVPVSLDERLRERSFGDYEGMLFSDFTVQLTQQRRIEGVGMYDVRPPNGESLRDAWHRIEPFANELFNTREPAMIVAHGASTALLLAHLLRGTLPTARGFRFGNTSLTELAMHQEGNFQLMRYNDISHLSEESTFSGTIDGATR